MNKINISINKKVKSIIFALSIVFPFGLSTVLLGRRVFVKEMPSSFLPLVIILFFFLFLLTLQLKSEAILKRVKYEKRKVFIIASSVLLIILITFIWRLILIKFFKTPPVTEFGIAFDMAKKWINGPSISPEHLFSPRWGIYTFVLSKFLLLGSTLFIAKLSSVLAAAISAVFVFLCLLKSTKKFLLAFNGGLIMALWPSFAIYSNILSSEHFFIMFFSISLFCLVMAISYYRNHPKLFFFFVLLFGISLSFANSFKDITIISIPAAVIVFAYFTSNRSGQTKKYFRDLAIIVFILLLSMFSVGLIRNSLVSYYAIGPVNTSSSLGYFLATGLNLENAGRYNPTIGEPYVQKLRDDLHNNTLDKADYERADQKLIDYAIQEAKNNYEQYPILFIKKFYTVWSNEDEINNLNYDAYTLSKTAPEHMTLDYLKTTTNKINLFSNSYFMFLAIFSTFCALFIFIKKTKALTPELYLSSIICVGFAAILIVMEVLTRYRSILYPAITIQATFGLYFLSEYLKNRYFKKK